MNTKRAQTRAILIPAVPEDVIQGLDQQATIEQRTRANLIRKILADYIVRLRSLAEKKNEAARG